MTRKTDKTTNLSRTLRKRIFTILIIGVVSGVGLLKFGPKIGSLFGLISVNRNATVTPPQANMPPPIFVDIPTATNKTKIDIRGFATPETNVELFVNGPKKGSVLTDSTGEFLFTDVELNKATNTIFAKIGETKSANLTIEYDNKLPEIEITNLEDGDEIKNLNERIEIQGKVNEKADITVNEKMVIQRSDNSFSFLLGVKEGEITITVKATDLAGNTDEEKIKVQYKKK